MSTISLQPLDITKPAKEIIIDKINALNGLTLAHEDFVMSPPMIDVTPSYDTSITLSPTVGSPWYGSMSIHYTRVKLDELLRPMLVTTNGERTLYDILDQINIYFGIYLTTDDVEDANIVFAKDGSNNDVLTLPLTCEVKAKDSSHLFVNDYVLPLNVNSISGSLIPDDSRSFMSVYTHGTTSYLRVLDSLGNENKGFRLIEQGQVLLNTQTGGSLGGLCCAFVDLGDNEYLLVGDLEFNSQYYRMLRFNSAGNVLASLTVATGYTSGDAGSLVIPDIENGFIYFIGGSDTAYNHHHIHRYDILTGVFDNDYSNAVNSIDISYLPKVDTSLICAAVHPTDGSLYIAFKNNIQPATNTYEITVRKIEANGTLTATGHVGLFTFQSDNVRIRLNEGVNMVVIGNTTVHSMLTTDNHLYIHIDAGNWHQCTYRHNGSIAANFTTGDNRLGTTSVFKLNKDLEIVPGFTPIVNSLEFGYSAASLGLTSAMLETSFGFNGFNIPLYLPKNRSLAKTDNYLIYTNYMVSAYHGMASCGVLTLNKDTGALVLEDDNFIDQQYRYHSGLYKSAANEVVMMGAAGANRNQMTFGIDFINPMENRLLPFYRSSENLTDSSNGSDFSLTASSGNHVVNLVAIDEVL